MIHATFAPSALEAAAADPESRTISGVAVPWNVTGRVSDGRLVRFLPGSLDAADAPVALLDHDPGRPFGVVAEGTDDGAAMRIRVRASRVPSGDEALTLAADGVRRAFSVGVDPIDWQISADDGALEVIRGAWNEVSLLVRGAFPGALVDSVSAAPSPTPNPSNPATQEAHVDPTAQPIPTPSASAVPTPVAAAPGGPAFLPPTGPPRAPEPMTLGRLASIVAAAPQGSVAAAVRSAIEAATSTTGALENILTADIAGMNRPAYLDEVRGIIEWGRPTIEAINRGPLPPTGMQVQWPHFVTQPTVDVQSTQKSTIATGAIEVETGSANVVTWAGGNDIALQVAQRSNPSFMEAYFRAAAQQMARKQNAYVLAQLLAEAVAVTPLVSYSFVGNVAELLGALDPLMIPAGPLFLAVSWDIGMSLIGVTRDEGPAFWSGSISLTGGVPAELEGLGLTMYVDRQLAAGTMLAGPRQGATWHEDPANPYEVRVIDVSLLGVDAGVYGFGALSIDYPKGDQSEGSPSEGLGTFVKMTGITPA